MITGIKVRNIFLRLLPYIISFLSGIIVYIIAEIHIKNDNLSSLAVNIAAALLSIPIIFIFYEVINRACTKDIKESLAHHLTFDINYAVIDLIKNIREMLGINEELNRDNLYNLLNMESKFIRKRLQLTDNISNRLKINKEKLQELIHGNVNLEALSEEQIKCLLGIIKFTGILHHEIQFNRDNTSKEFIAQSLFELLALIEHWIDLVEEDAVINHHSFQII